jgi:hypothetical protein
MSGFILPEFTPQQTAAAHQMQQNINHHYRNLEPLTRMSPQDQQDLERQLRQNPELLAGQLRDIQALQSNAQALVAMHMAVQGPKMRAAEEAARQDWERRRRERYQRTGRWDSGGGGGGGGGGSGDGGGGDGGDGGGGGGGGGGE